MIKRNEIIWLSEEEAEKELAATKQKMKVLKLLWEFVKIVFSFIVGYCVAQIMSVPLDVPAASVYGKSSMYVFGVAAIAFVVILWYLDEVAGRCDVLRDHLNSHQRARAMRFQRIS